MILNCYNWSRGSRQGPRKVGPSLPSEEGRHSPENTHPPLRYGSDPHSRCHRVWPSMEHAMNIGPVVLLVFLLTIYPSTRASAREDPSCSQLRRSNLVSCVLSASLVVKAEGEQLEAARGRQTAASPILP